MMYIWCMNKSNLYKGCLEPIILQLLKQHDKLYGYQITQMVKEMTHGELIITEGALYPLLHKLEENGIVEIEMVNIGNRIRKYYALTKVGKKQSYSSLKELQNFVNSLEQFIKPSIA